MLNIGILEKADFSLEVVSNLKNIGKVSFFDNIKLEDFLVNKDILFIRLNFYIGNNFLSQAKRLKYICTPTTGLNHIDLELCKKNNIKILSLKDEKDFLLTIRATPEHTFGLVLALLRNYKKCFLNNNNNNWNRDLYKGHELYKKNVGIIGFGRVGSILSKYFDAFDAVVNFYDINDEIKSSYAKKKDSIKELIISSDIIILSASYSSEYDSFFNKDYIDLLENKYFINTARGELICEEYLIEKISSSFFKGIALDVVNNESKNSNNIDTFIDLAEKENLLLSSHIAGATYESMWKTENFIYHKLLKEFTFEK